MNEHSSLRAMLIKQALCMCILIKLCAMLRAQKIMIQAHSMSYAHAMSYAHTMSYAYNMIIYTFPQTFRDPQAIK